jgi:cephalosporin hydroxylase
MDAKAIVRRVVPDSVLSARHRRRGNLWHSQPIPLRDLDRIKNASPETLRDAQAMTEMIADLGLNDHYPEDMPGDLQGRLGCGLRISQYPIQFAPYLVFLADRPIRSYVEIGVQHGGTFAVTVAYLRATGTPLERAVAADIAHSFGATKFARRNRGVSFFRGDSRSDEFRQVARATMPGGLVLVDGDHTEEGCRADVVLADEHDAAIIAVHDIDNVDFPGVRTVWQDMRERDAGRFSFHEFVVQYPDVSATTGSHHLGIGVAVRSVPWEVDAPWDI